MKAAGATSERPVLLTAFEPFGGAAINASREAARLLAADDPRLVSVTLPVARGAAETRAWATLDYLIRDGTPPALILSLGEAGPEPVVRLEKVAVNWDDFRIPDNAGNQPRDEPIMPDGPAAYFATVPVARIAAALAGRTPLPVTVSLSAGAFLCNHLAYAMLQALAERPVTCPYLFVHVPAWRPGGAVSLAAIAETLRAVLDSALAIAEASENTPVI